MKKDDVVLTRGVKRAIVPKEYYDKISTLIISILEEKEEVPFVYLVEKVEEAFAGQLKGNVTWYFLYIKQDLEAGGVIKIRLDQRRSQWITLRSKYREKLLINGNPKKLMG